MLNTSEITGIILAGGKSRRMGTDKAFLSYKNKPLIAHVIAALEPVTSEIMIISDSPKYDVFNKTRKQDLIKNAGPLAGLYTGLYHSETPYNLVLGCDTPLVNRTLFDLLFENVSENYDIIQLASRQSTMPLLALYKKTCMHQCLELLEKGERRLQESVATFSTKTVGLSETQERFILNINTPKDLQSLGEDD